MSIQTDDELNFLPDEVEWAAEYPPAIHNQVEGIVPAIHDQVGSIVTGVFWVGALMVAGFFLLGFLAMIFSPQPQHSQSQQVQEIHQQPSEQKPAAHRPVIVKTIEVDGVTIQLDREGNAYGSLPEHLYFADSAYPLRVFDAPAGRFVRVFPPKTPFIATTHTYQTHWKWITNFDRISGFVNFQAPPENEPPGPTTSNGPVFVKTLNINGMTAGLTQDGSMYGPIPIEFRFGYNMQPLQIFDAPGGRISAVFPPKTAFVITRNPVQANWRWIINFDDVQGFTTFKPSVFPD